MAATMGGFGSCKLEFYEHNECKGNQWQMPTYYPGELDAGFYPPYSYTPSSCNDTFSNDLTNVDRHGSSFSSSRRSSNVSPGASMSEDGCYTPLSDPDSMYRSIRTPFAYCSTPNEICTSAYNERYMQVPHIRPDSYGYVSSECWSDSKGYPCQPSSLTDQLDSKYDVACERVQSRTQSHASSNPDPSLSRSIIFNDAMPESENMREHLLNRIPSSISFAAPETITPRTAFHAVLSSSPGSMICPVTPIKGFDASGFDSMSSPVTDLTPTSSSRLSSKMDWVQKTKTAWSDLDGCSHNLTSSSPTINVRSKLRESSRCGVSKQQRKKMSPLKGPKSAVHEHSNDDEALIPNNEFFCSFPNCRQSNTKRTSFRRQEHLKRHEKTVHGDAKPFRCRFCGRGFNRNDNLAQHYKTHSRNKSSSRNHWVAVLDESSIYYDPDFEGPITRDGYPIRDGLEIIQCPSKGCVDVFHTEEALKAHEMKKEHRHEGAGMLVAVGVKSKSHNSSEK